MKGDLNQLCERCVNYPSNTCLLQLTPVRGALTKEIVCTMFREPYRVGVGGVEREEGSVEGRARVFETGATRDVDHDKLDFESFLSPAVLKRFAEYLQKHRVQSDGNLRDSDNWQKGIPKDVYMKSMFRHFMEVWETHREVSEHDMEEALCGVMFNSMGYLFEILREIKTCNCSDCTCGDEVTGD